MPTMRSLLALLAFAASSAGQNCAGTGYCINQQTAAGCEAASGGTYHGSAPAATDGAPVAAWSGGMRSPACYGGCLYEGGRFWFNEAAGANCPSCGKSDSCATAGDVHRVCPATPRLRRLRRRPGLSLCLCTQRCRVVTFAFSCMPISTVRHQLVATPT